MPEQITIIEIGAKGDGIAIHNGERVFVPRAAAGDVIDADIIQDRDGAFRAKIRNIVTPGPGRASPPCAYFDRCGGCQIQHIAPEFYRDFKTGLVRDALSRVKIEPETWENPVFIPPGTRRRVNFAALMTKGRIDLGFHQQRSHAIVDVDSCLLLTPGLNDLRGILKSELPHLLPEGKIVDIFLQEVDGATEMILTGPIGRKGPPDAHHRSHLAMMAQSINLARIGWRAKDFAPIEKIIDRGPLAKKCGPLTVDIPWGGFLQPSVAGEAALVSAVMRHLPACDNAADLFSGCGTFTGPMLSKAKRVQAIEAGPEPVAALKKAGHQDAEKRDLFKNPLKSVELNDFDAIVFDPPRAGAAAQASEIAASYVKTVIGVSCSPATFARDARLLVDGGYRLTHLQVVDQFYGSAHVETVGVFRKD